MTFKNWQKDHNCLNLHPPDKPQSPPINKNDNDLIYNNKYSKKQIEKDGKCHQENQFGHSRSISHQRTEIGSGEEQDHGMPAKMFRR